MYLIKVFPRTLFIICIPLFAMTQAAIQNTDSAKLKSSPKSYDEIITRNSKTSIGLFKVHKIDDKWYFEIPDSLVDREILVVSRIAKGGAGTRGFMSGYAGDEINENTIAFSKGLNNKIFLKTISDTEISKDSSENGMFRSVRNSNLQPIAAAFDIKTRSKDSTTLVVDVTDYVNGDNDILFFDPNIKKGYGLTNIQPDRSYIQDINAFPSNIEIHTVKTYIKANIGPLPVAPTPATFELNSSLVLLPKVPMQPRYFDERVGYFATSFTDFDANPQGVKETAMITRWKLEPKDKEAYLRGDLVEPIKPILFYIDPATPKKWMPYLILGVNDWNIAFEQAGFKNAIIAKEAPVNDSSWNIDDATHNAIVYKPSAIANASGPHVHDPRSGEIIETHINWYHNVMDVLHKWFFIQTAAVDQNAQKPQFSDSLMGRLIRFVVSHEVGHTLGLRHNFGSSSTVPVDSMRSKSYLENNGYTPSIMDYSRFNYVAQPEDNIPERDLIPRIGAYDKWAIEWGYRWFPNKETREQETERLNKWVIDKSSHNKQFWFGTEADPNDPRSQNEDLGDDAMKAGEYGIKNLKRIYPHLIEWTKEPAEDYEPLKKMYSELVIQFGRYMGHAAKNIGGIMTTPRTVEEKGTVIEFVPKLKQQEAMQFLQAQLFKTPNWLIDKKMDDLMGDNPLNTIGNLQNNILGRLISGNTIDKLIRFEASDPRNAYTASMMLQDLRNGIWSELSTHQLIDINRRNLQKQYVELLVAMINPQAVPPPARSTNDQLSIVKQHAKGLLTSIKDDLPFVRDPETKWHLQDCVERLTEALNLKK